MDSRRFDRGSIRVLLRAFYEGLKLAGSKADFKGIWLQSPETACKP